MFRPFALFVGLRYTGARARNSFISVITLISALGLMLGVGLLLCFQGFVAMTNQSLGDIDRKRGFWKLNAGVAMAVVSMVVILQVAPTS